jgi:hypothetical protein
MFAKNGDEMKSQDENNTHEKDRIKLVFSAKVGLTGLSPSVLHCRSLSSLNQASQNKIQSLELISTIMKQSITPIWLNLWQHSNWG